MSARRGADSQDSPATRHPIADVLSQPSVRTNDSCGLQYCEYSIRRDKKDSISGAFVVKQKQALAKMQCPRYESPARRSASAGCRYWSTGRTGDRIFQPSKYRLGMYRPGNRCAAAQDASAAAATGITAGRRCRPGVPGRVPRESADMTTMEPGLLWHRDQHLAAVERNHRK